MTDTKSGLPPPDSSIPSDPPPEYSATHEHAPLLSRRASQPPQRRPPPPLEIPILAHLRTHRVVLASASPRRKHILGQLGLNNLEIWPSTKPENLDKVMYGPHEYVAATAHKKCLDVYQAVIAAQDKAEELAGVGGAGVPADPELVIAADTIIVTRAGKILEKPRSAAEHIQMLRHLRDTKTHRVLTSLCVLSPRRDAAHPGYSVTAHTEETTVVFAQPSAGLTDKVIESYVRTREGADKAGGYALQGTGGLILVERIEGSMDNVIGLPARKFLELADKVIFHQDEDEEEESGEEEVAGIFDKAFQGEL